MNCSCIFDAGLGEDGTSEENCKTDYVRSKTFHVCGECGRKIPPGEKYLLEIVKWCGAARPTRYKTCADCESLRYHLCCDWMFGTVRDDIADAIEYGEDEDLPWATFAKLTPNARAFVFDVIEDLWEGGDL